ncbi:MAG TPA: hypothetical protein VJP79_01830 [Nitrososphaera sp.]|nr:hypothetical protein [Nitrososphaera sp.]
MFLKTRRDARTGVIDPKFPSILWPSVNIPIPASSKRIPSTGFGALVAE